MWNKYTPYQIGDRIQDNQRDLIIISKEKRSVGSKNKMETYVQYKCRICNQQSWTRETNMHRGQGCTVCKGHTIQKGYNDIATLRPDLAIYFDNEEDTFKYSVNSNKNVKMRCPKCGYKKNIRVYQLVATGFSCPICNECPSLLEKIIVMLLWNNKVDFVYQVTNSYFPWSKRYVYDFYLPKTGTIIEVDGTQHTMENNEHVMFYRTVGDIKQIDLKKEDLAKQNGIQNYIHIRYSKPELYKIDFLNSIIDSGLLDVISLDIETMNYDKAYKDAVINLVSPVCEYYELHKADGTLISDIGKHFGKGTAWVSRYLRIGKEIGITSYNKTDTILNVKRNYVPSNALSVKIISPNGEVNTFMSIEQGRQYLNKVLNKSTGRDKFRLICHKGGEIYGYKCEIIN